MAWPRRNTIEINGPRAHLDPDQVVVYVARKLGQSADMVRAAASSGRVERDYQIVSPIIDSREIAEMWEKGEKGL